MNAKTEIVTKQKAVTFIVQDPARLASRLKNLIVNGKKLSDEECLALAQYSVATDLNPFVGECYFLPSIGPGPGIAGWRKKAEEMLQFEAEKAKIPVAKFWCEYVQNGEGEAHYNPEKGDIAVKAILHDEISRTKWEKRILSHFIELIKSQVEKDEAWKLANELGGPEPTWSAVAVVHGSENFGATEKYDRYERCCKRAEKLAIRKRFPLIDLPEPVGFDENYIDAEVKDVPEQLPPEQPQIEQPQPAGNGNGKAPMNLEEAKAITNRDGTKYGNIGPEDLKHMARSLSNVANRTIEQEDKLLAIQLIQADRSKETK